jgi:hypothetical protein
MSNPFERWNVRYTSIVVEKFDKLFKARFIKPMKITG